MALNSKKGFTLVEMLVVISLFAIIAVITTQSIIRIIGSTSSSNSSTKTRENIEHALSVVERSIRNAKEITSCTTSPTRIQYVTQDGVSESFQCRTIGSRTTIEQNNRSLISDQINLPTCNMTCTTPVGQTNPTAVQIELEGTDITGSYTAEPVKLQTTILLRSY